MHLINIDHEGKTYQLLADGERRLIRDLELARILGYGRHRRIRELIAAHASSLGVISPYRAAKFALDGEAMRGRPDQGFDLTEEQALFIVAKSDLPRATEILKLIIEVFLKAVRGELSAQPAPVNIEAAIARGVSMALAAQVAAMPELIQRAVSVELDKRTGVLGPHAKRVLKTIAQQADLASRGARRGSSEWNRIRGRRDSALRDMLCWRGRWDRCPRSVGEVENALQVLSRDLGPGLATGAQLALVPRQ